MKKSLIALAVAGAFAAPAFAATENVDVYGKLHMSVSAFDDQPVGTNDVQISSNASRFGIKGAEDLGGGLSGIWQIESGVNLDEQSGTLASRNSFVGLKGGFGTVLLGNHDTPLKLVGRAVDLFGDTMADSRNVLGGGSDARAQNVLAYITPNMGGFSIAAAYTTDLNGRNATTTRNAVIDTTTGLPVVPAAHVVTSSTNANAGDDEDVAAYNLNATYNNGPIFVGLGYGDGDYHEVNGLGAHIRAAAGLTFGPAKIVAQYDTLEADVGSADFSAFMVGGAFTFGNVVLKANYMEGEVDGVPAADSEQFAVGADYNLSKRTTVYGLYAAGENVVLGSGAGSSDRIGSCGTCGGDVSVISLGVTHSF
jgi:predicted porin